MHSHKYTLIHTPVLTCMCNVYVYKLIIRFSILGDTLKFISESLDIFHSSLLPLSGR